MDPSTPITVPIPPLITKWFWVAFIVAVVVNALILWRRAQRDLATHPEKRASYARLLRGYLFWFGFPWLVAGGIILAGGATSLFDFFHPRDAGAAVAGWHGLLWIFWAAAIHWIYVRDGAEQLVAHPAFLGPGFASVSAIRFSIAGGLVAALAAEIVMWCSVFPRFH